MHNSLPEKRKLTKCGYFQYLKFNSGKTDFPLFLQVPYDKTVLPDFLQIDKNILQMDKNALPDFLQMNKNVFPDFLQMAADLIPGITSIQLDFSMDSLLPLFIITTLNILLIALLLGTRSDLEKVLLER